MTPHRQLLAEYANQNSQEAFQQLVTLYIGMVHSSAVRLVNGDTHRAQDIVQTVFADLARHAHLVSEEATLGGWLHRRTCYVAATMMRGERRRQNREREAVEMSALHEDGDEALAQVAPVLDEAINQLNAQDRDAIMLRFFERCDLRTVGNALGSNEDAAQKRISRALEKLRQLLVRRGVTLSVATLALALGSPSATAAPAGLALTVSTGVLAGTHSAAGFSLTTLKILIMTNLKTTVIAAVLLVGAGTTAIVAMSEETYTPTAALASDPSKILQEAQADTAGGRFPEALAKHIWYHENALKYQPSQSGVRVSFALSYWAELAQKYPPARKKMISLRDKAEKTVRKNPNDSKTALEAFSEVNGFNRVLKEDKKTSDLFRWLHSENPDLARRVFRLVQDALIANGEYALCGQYIDPNKSYAEIVELYSHLKKPLPGDTNPQFKKIRLDLADKMFATKAASLVALLALNNRGDDADRIAAQAAKEWNDPAFLTKLNEAKQGVMPEPLTGRQRDE